MLTIDNVTKLRKILLSHDKTMGAGVREFYESLHDELVSYSGGDESVMLANMRSSLRKASSSGISDPRCVADIIYSWGIAYPEQISTLIKVLHELPLELRGKGEGIAIGMMEVLNCIDFEEGNQYAKDFFEGLVKGGIFEIMNNSEPSSTGSGRLTNAISLFTVHAWGQSKLAIERRAICALALRALRNNLDTFFKESALYDIRQLTEIENGNFLMKFAREFASKFMLGASLKALLSSSYGFSETEMEEWQKRFPELVFVNE